MAKVAVPRQMLQEILALFARCERRHPGMKGL
jgi:hypothetical protein